MHGDQRVIYLDEATPVVAGLYASALYVRAARDLAVSTAPSATPAAGAAGTARADSRRPPSTGACGSADRGFYRMHTFPSAPPPGWTPPDDADVFALGGNTLAALSGIGADARSAA